MPLSDDVDEFLYRPARLYSSNQRAESVSRSNSIVPITGPTGTEMTDGLDKNRVSVPARIVGALRGGCRLSRSILSLGPLLDCSTFFSTSDRGDKGYVTSRPRGPEDLIGVCEGEEPLEAAVLCRCAPKRVDQVWVDTRGPEHSSSEFEAALLALDNPFPFPIYTCNPAVLGNPNSLAIATNIPPSVACKGISLPRFHFLLLFSASSG